MILKRNFFSYGRKWLTIEMYNVVMGNIDSTIHNRYRYAKKFIITKTKDQSEKGEIARKKVY